VLECGNISKASFDVASMCATSTKIFVLEVMGRHAGWIAAAGGLVDDSIPVVILFPEATTIVEKIANIVCFKYFNQSFVFCPVVFQRFHLITTRTKAARRGVLECGNISIRFLAMYN
jgi:6-phosphofructokinase